MPIGTFDLPFFPTAVAGQALPIAVCLYTPGAQQPYTIIPNVRCLRIDYREGPEPPAARFQYLMGNLLAGALGWPAQFEQIWPLNTQGNYTVQVDDRLVVITSDPFGNPVVLFDGFAQIPQVDLAGAAQGVTFVAVGVAARLWDMPITGRTQRNGDDATTTDGSEDVDIEAPARFNPADNSIGAIGGYIGNATGDSYDTELAGDEGTFPVFIDPLLIERAADQTAYWSTGGVLKYLMATQSFPVDAAQNEYVQFPTFSSIDLLVEAYAALNNGVLNSSTASTSMVNIRDYDASNKSVPQVFADLLGYAGLVMVYTCAIGSDNLPLTELKILRRDALSSSTPKALYLAQPGTTSTLQLSANNTTALHLARDTNNLVNQWDVETQLKQVEITVYLAPGFQPAGGDNSAANLPKWSNANLTNATSTQRRMYRWFIADECGDGHWNADSSSWVTDTPLDLSPVFPNDKNGNPTYCKRYRPGQRTLISKDAEGKPLKAVLEILKGVTSDDPALISTPNTGTWVTIVDGWQLLDDRLGIEITIEDPNEWGTGAGKRLDSNATIRTIRTVDWLAAPSSDTNFTLRLTTVIDSDKQIDVQAPKRIASPTQFARQRTADGKDHFQYCSIAVGSVNYQNQGGDGTNPVIIRDDTKAATSHAVQLRTAHEFPVLAGSVTIPFLTDYYQIGDRIKIVQGRGASLQINVGADQGESPTYPWVTAFSWVLEHDRQETTLQLSDRRAEPQGV
jgi:hypothetical protein